MTCRWLQQARTKRNTEATFFTSVRNLKMNNKTIIVTSSAVVGPDRITLAGRIWPEGSNLVTPVVMDCCSYKLHTYIHV